MSYFLFLNIIYTFVHYIPHFILLQSYFFTNIYEWFETEAYYISSYNKAMRYKKNSRNQQRAAGAKTYFL